MACPEHGLKVWTWHESPGSKTNLRRHICCSSQQLDVVWLCKWHGPYPSVEFPCLEVQATTKPFTWDMLYWIGIRGKDLLICPMEGRRVSSRGLLILRTFPYYPCHALIKINIQIATKCTKQKKKIPQFVWF